MGETAREILEGCIKELSSFNWKSRVDMQQGKRTIKALKLALEKLDEEEPMVQVIEADDK